MRYAYLYDWKVMKNDQITINIDEKENNMITNSFGHDTQRYYDVIKNYLKAESVSIEEKPDCHPSVEIRGHVPQDAHLNGLKEYGKMYKNEKDRFAPNPIPQCKGIIRRDKTTRVDWEDGTRTVIVLEEGKEDMDMFHTFCIAFTKKMLGSTTKILKTIEDCDSDTIERKRKEAIEEANKKAEETSKRLAILAERQRFEEAVAQKMFDERVREEAIWRLMKQNEKLMNEEALIEEPDEFVDLFEEEKTEE